MMTSVNLGTIALAGAGGMMLVVGALHLVAPQMMMEAPMIELTSANHHHVIRAAYGGAYLGIAALFLLGLANRSLRASSLLAVTVLFLGFALGRLVSMAVDGLPVGLYLGVLAFEVTFAVLALVARRSDAENNPQT
ncbi:MAG: DUF4345 domain-containing protein [Pseudorhodobacter sp.]